LLNEEWFISAFSLCVLPSLQKRPIVGYSTKLVINQDLFVLILVTLTVHCHHEMKRPYIATVGEGFQLQTEEADPESGQGVVLNIGDRTWG
jgi:hypothetical protein